MTVSAPETMRSRMKAAMEWALVSSGAATVARRRLNNGAFIIAYHNVLPDGAAAGSDVSLHLPRGLFAAQLDTLMRTHEIVRLDEALRAPAYGGRHGRPLAAITFDDAYRGALTVGMQEVRARRLEATTFVAPAFLGGDAFWWDEVDWPAGSNEGDRFRARALDECGGQDAAVRSLASKIGYATIDVPAYARCITGLELREIATEGGLSIGAHTWNHVNLDVLDDATLESELSRPLEWLRDQFDAVVPWLAYPYGRSSPRVVEATRRAGYTLAVRGGGGWLRERPLAIDPLAVPRYNVPAGLTPNGFVLRASGIFCQ